MKKAAIFVDVQNMYYTTRDTYQRSVNYRRLWDVLSEQYEIVSANAYAIHRGNDQQLKFQSALKHIGFTVKLKPFIQRSDGSAKGDWDVGITIDALSMAPNIDTLILLSGDGDFDLLLEKVRRDFNVETHVYGVKKLSAQSLIQSADHFHPIDEDLLM